MDHFTILLVEDNACDADLVAEAFRDRFPFIRLHVTMDGEEALGFLCRQDAYADMPRPHLVLLDLNLPKKSGFDVLKTVKQEEALRDIPVAVFSSSESPVDIANAYKLHANCYVVKPIHLESFWNAVNAIVRFWCTIVTLPKNP